MGCLIREQKIRRLWLILLNNLVKEIEVSWRKRKNDQENYRTRIIKTTIFELFYDWKWRLSQKYSFKPIFFIKNSFCFWSSVDQFSIWKIPNNLSNVNFQEVQMYIIETLFIIPKCNYVHSLEKSSWLRHCNVFLFEQIFKENGLASFRMSFSAAMNPIKCDFNGIP